jgi:hypothetical protein
MTYSIQSSFTDIKKFEQHILDLMQQYDGVNSSNILLTSTKDDTTSVIDFNFSSELTDEQYSLLMQAISTYQETPSDEYLYRTVPYVMNNINVVNTEYSLINSILYSGTNYNEVLTKLRVSGRINSSDSNAYYSLRVVDTTNNVIMGSNNFTNTEFAYGVISLNSTPFDIVTLELQGKKGILGDSFDINGVQMVYVFR